MVRVADALAKGRVGWLSGAVRRGPRLRIALTHYVDQGRMADYGRIAEFLLEEHVPVTPEAVLSEGTWPDRAVAFTFDDGLLSSYRAAQEVLNPLGIKAMFFVPTQIMTLRSPDEMRDFFRERVYRRAATAMPEERYVTMSIDQMRELHAQGHSLLPHTHTHIALDRIRTDADVRRELLEPRDRLEELVQQPCRGFAFPFGNEEVVGPHAYQHVQRTYRVTFTGLTGANTPRTPSSSLYRDCLHPHFTLGHVRNLVGGALDPVYALKMRRLRRRAGLDR